MQTIMEEARIRSKHRRDAGQPYTKLDEVRMQVIIAKYVYKYRGCNMNIYIYIYIYIYNCLCGSVAKASDTQAVGHGFDPCPDH